MNHRSAFIAITICLLLGVISLWPQPLQGQADNGDPVPRQLTITDITAERLPEVRLRVRGRMSNGTPIDYGQAQLVITHGTQTLANIAQIATDEVGTFTIFLVDTPLGTEDQLRPLSEAILEYASDELMKEQVDHIALFQVGPNGATELMAPDLFYNSIRNYLVDPLPTSNGPTALLDSIGDLLDTIEERTPLAEQAVSLVVFSDGTDVVSTNYDQADLVSLAVDKGIAVHTVLIPNSNLSNASSGETFLRALAIESGGIAASLGGDSAMAPIWQAIIAHRNQAILSYVPDVTPGDTPITVSFDSAPAIQAGATIFVPDTLPVLKFDVPVDARNVVIGDLTEPVTLALPTTLSWLDGEEREITQAQLWVNDLLIGEINPTSLPRFTATIPNFRIGPNRVWLVAVDADVQRAITPELQLIVEQGDTTVIPELLRPATGIGWISWLLGCIGGLLLAVALGAWAITQRGGQGQLTAPLSQLLDLLPRGGRNRPSRSRKAPNITSSGPGANRDPITAFALDVIEAETPVYSPIGIQGIELRIGRSPSQADIIFENDLTVSRIHASIVKEHNSYRIFDEQSTSGTLVNQQTVPDYGALLIDGDEIQMGKVRLRFRIIRST